jgi:hypothetical protein
MAPMPPAAPTVAPTTPMTLPTTTALPSISVAPTIQASLVSQIELLDKSKNNWMKWK